MSPKEIVALKLTESGELEFTLTPWVWLVVAVLIVLIYWWRRRATAKHWEPVEVEVPFGGGKVKIVPNYEVLKIAHQAWTELVTRKAGLRFEEEHDVIVEVYDSWYKLFAEVRTLIKSIPAQRLRESADAQELVRILLLTLNDGLRPHLTCWQARFRRWYAVAEKADENKEKTPQEIQRQYPEYAALVADLIRVNEQMMQFADSLRQISQAKPEK